MLLFAIHTPISLFLLPTPTLKNWPVFCNHQSLVCVCVGTSRVSVWKGKIRVMLYLCFPFCGRRQSIFQPLPIHTCTTMERVIKKIFWGGGSLDHSLSLYLSPSFFIHVFVSWLLCPASHPIFFILFLFTCFVLLLFPSLLLYLFMLLFDHSVFSNKHYIGPQGAFIAFQSMCVWGGLCARAHRCACLLLQCTCQMWLITLP